MAGSKRPREALKKSQPALVDDDDVSASDDDDFGDFMNDGADENAGGVGLGPDSAPRVAGYGGKVDEDEPAGSSGHAKEQQDAGEEARAERRQQAPAGPGPQSLRASAAGKGGMPLSSAGEASMLQLEVSSMAQHRYALTYATMRHTLPTMPFLLYVAPHCWEARSRHPDLAVQPPAAQLAVGACAGLSVHHNPPSFLLSQVGELLAEVRAPFSKSSPVHDIIATLRAALSSMPEHQVRPHAYWCPCLSVHASGDLHGEHVLAAACTAA